MSDHQLQRGYTLLEVLISSTLFVGILVVATSTLATSSRLREAASAQLDLADSGQHVIELIVRDARDATGWRDTDGGFRGGLEPIRFLGGSLLPDGRRTSDRLALTSSHPDEPLQAHVSVYEVVPHPDVASAKTLQVVRSTYLGATALQLGPSTTELVLPRSLQLEEGEPLFRGLGHADTTTQQPFLTIALSLRSVEDVPTPIVQQFQTSVTSQVQP